MPFVRKSKKSVRKPVRKYTRKPSMKRSSLVKLIKKVSLKPCETKHTHNINENINLAHNSPDLNYNHLQTVQSFTDNNQGASNFSCRLGDEVILRGLSYKFWFANKADRPNIMYKIIIFRYKSGTTPASPAPYYPQGTSNYMIRDLDTESYKILKVVKFTVQTGAQRIRSELGTPIFSGAEGHRAISIWIPLKNQKLKYENGTGTPKFTDIGYNVVAYDSFGTLSSDNIATFAVNRKLYFKDP